MNKLICIAIFFTVAESVYAQQISAVVRGRVLEESTNTPIAFANIIVENSDPVIGTVSDQEGYFLLKNVPVGRHTFKVTFLGYEPAIKREVLISTGKELYMEFFLKESLLSMEEISITPEVIKENPVNRMAVTSSRLLSVEEASRYAGGFDDPARLASSFAGVASNIASNGIVIRGNAPKALLWRLEGVDIPNPNHFAELSAFGGGGLTALSSQMLANSDFMTGAFPAEYGNALSGVFDLRMRKGNHQKREHTLQAGIIGLDAASEGPFSSNSKSSYLFNYRYSTLALLTPVLPEDADGTRYQDLAFKVNIQAGKTGVFDIWGIGLKDQSGQIADQDSSVWRFEQDREEQDVSQGMGAVGITHAKLFREKSFLKSGVALTTSWLNFDSELLDDNLELQSNESIKDDRWDVILHSSLDHKFSTRHNNQTGIKAEIMNYKLIIRKAEDIGQPEQSIVDDQGSSVIYSAYTSSRYRFSGGLSATGGVHATWFTLNDELSIEPRAGLKWFISSDKSISLGYGLHSRLEKLSFYLARSPENGSFINKDIRMAKAHHFVLGYDQQLDENHRIKIEPYYQYLFDVPVIADSSFSMINLLSDFFINDKMENKGAGRNIGIDVTFERFLHRGFYYLMTGSVFRSTYKAGDGIWRSTRFDKNYVVNLLAGKEWMLGSSKQNILGVNIRFTLQGGDRFTPADQNASVRAAEVILDDGRAFNEQFPASQLLHFTISWQINKKQRTSTWALKVLNATGVKEFDEFRYNYRSKKVVKNREALVIPNLSYKIEF